MSEEEIADNRIFVSELVKALFDTGNFDHLDGYGGAILAMDVEEATEALRKKGWSFTKEET